ncbi:MAG: hypothetical protein ACK4K0_00335 [Flavobacteriales bacterium]
MEFNKFWRVMGAFKICAMKEHHHTKEATCESYNILVKLCNAI